MLGNVTLYYAKGQSHTILVGVSFTEILEGNNLKKVLEGVGFAVYH